MISLAKDVKNSGEVAKPNYFDIGLLVRQIENAAENEDRFGIRLSKLDLSATLHSKRNFDKLDGLLLFEPSRPTEVSSA